MISEPAKPFFFRSSGSASTLGWELVDPVLEGA